jgi:DNA repair exonuclease SbcCD nuclease subunit
MFKKAACFTDIHFGLKNNSRQHNNDCEAFVKWFIDEAKKFGAETCIFLGDWHHHRSSINISTLNYSISNLKRLSEAFDQTYFLVGNHDLFYRDKREISSVVFAQEIPKVKVVDEIIVKDDVALVPWLIGNEWKKIKNIKAKYMFGHFELPNFKMNAMVEMPDHGELNASHFGNVDLVFSGHFHKRQTQGNVTYIGNPFAHNYADAWDNDRGCMMLEWGSMNPKYMIWPAGPKYRTITLSKLLEAPDDYLEPETHVRVKIDIDITYEEANFIKENFQNTYSLREISLLPHKEIEDELEFQGEIKFQSVDEIVLEQLRSIESETFDNSVLVEIYNRL